MNTENEKHPPVTPKRVRARIPMAEPKGVPVMVDALEFTKNKCSENARKIGNEIASTDVEYWIDKHYHIRNQQGDDYGRRDGIEQDKVLALVKECIKHLMLYSASVKNFSFLNHSSQQSGERMIRVACQKECKDGKLNVIIEAHAIKLNLFEITMITAIQKTDFTLSDGQYAVEITAPNESTLWFNSRGKVSEISNI